MNHIALVDDMNVGAAYRIDQFNCAGFPTTFMDGGDTLIVGGYTQESYYRDRIEAAGARTVPDLDLIIKMDHVSGVEYEITLCIGNGVAANTEPAIPDAPSGPESAGIGESVTFDVMTTDPESNDLYYQFDWGNGEMSSWCGPFASGVTCSESYNWDSNGDYDVKVRVKDNWDATTDWSPVSTISIGCCSGIRGNIDNDPADNIDIADLVYFVTFSFGGGSAPECFEEADVDASTELDIGDIVYVVTYMFGGGPAPLSCP